MGEVVFFAFIFVFILFLFGLFSISEGRGNPLGGLSTRRRAANVTRANAAAKMAMQRAGYEGGSGFVSVNDVGLLAYRQTEEPKLVRYNDVLMDTRYLRPFVALSVPYQARGMVRFEILDGTGRLRYADETRYDLGRGDNTLLPGTWLPVRHDQADPGHWTARVLVGETLLAVHTFSWQPVGGGEIQRYMQSDGEISPELEHLLQRPARAMSLSELLADQEE